MTINTEWVSILKISHPAAFKQSMPVVPVSWFVDGQIKLMKTAWITTWENFFKMQFVHTIDHALDSGAQVVIMGFDDYTHVPVCKGMTQRKRNKLVQTFAYDSAKGLPDAPPQDWNTAMSNRTFKVAVIQFISKNIALHYKGSTKTSSSHNSVRILCTGDQLYTLLVFLWHQRFGHYICKVEVSGNVTHPHFSVPCCFSFTLCTLVLPT
jgi:hypothetical protein